MQAFAFQPVRHESGIFRFECIKACLRQDLPCYVESVRLQHEIEERSNSPPPMSRGQMPRPVEDLVHQIPSLPDSKRRQMPGVCPGGGCLSFDLTDTLLPCTASLRIGLLPLNLVFARF